MINPRSSNDPELKSALQAWDGVNFLREKSFEDAMQIRTALSGTSSHQAFGWAALTGGRIAAYRGDVNLAESLLTEALGRFYLVGDDYGRGMAISHLAIPQVSRGNLDRALELALQPLSSDVPFLDQDRSLLHNSAAQCYWAREESHHAIAHLVKGFDLSRNAGDFMRGSVTLGNMGAVLLSLGEWDLALNVTRKAWNLQLENCTDQKELQTSQLSNMVLLNCLLGDHRAALRDAEQLLACSAHTNAPAAWLQFLSLVDAFALNGKLDQALFCLGRARTLVENNQTAFASAHMQLAEGVYLEAEKKYQAAIDLAHRVLEQPRKVVNRTAHLGAALILSRAYLALGRRSDSIKWKRWATDLRFENPLGDILTSQIRASLQFEKPAQPLTEMELVCLSLAARGQTSADIALKLGIKTRTVNFHFSNILRKLNAANRQEAIAKASAANLLRRL